MTTNDTPFPNPPPQGGRGAQQGFTLIELLIVLAILGLLIGFVALPNVMQYFGRAKADLAKLEVQRIEQALDLYRLDVGRYPTQEEGLRALVGRPPAAQRWNGPYVKGGDLPQDPWGRGFLYEVPSKRGLAFDLYSLGADGARGGDGENADVYNK